MNLHSIKHDNRLKLSYQDYVSFPSDGKRHEIVDGEHHMAPSPEIRHQDISRNLALIIASYLKENNLGKLLYAPCDVILSNWDIVVPDLIFISRENEKVITRKNIRGVPDLVVEIISPASRKYDLGMKKKLYERFGVKEYWIIDPEKERVEVYTLVNQRFLEPEVYNRDQVMGSSFFPGLRINLTEIFSC
ncbi:MAG: Uma2 family endonuclease [bacterium]